MWNQKNWVEIQGTIKEARSVSHYKNSIFIKLIIVCCQHSALLYLSIHKGTEKSKKTHKNVQNRKKWFDYIWITRQATSSNIIKAFKILAFNKIMQTMYKLSNMLDNINQYPV